jgi:predicted lipase
MKHTYKVFTQKEVKDYGVQYFKECQQNEIVHLVVVKKRKFATVSWDAITLHNPKQMIKDSENCTFNRDIMKLYEEYQERVNFKKTDLSYCCGTTNGFIYIYNEDIEDILPAICKLLDSMIKSKCLIFIEPQEKYKDFPENLKKYLPKNLGF